MKKVLFCLVPLLFLLSACFSDPVQDDLIDYNNQDLKKAAQLEKEAIDAYDSVTGANYTSDAVMYDTMTSEVIPTYRKFVDELENIDVETDDLRKVHEGYIKAANTQYNAFIKIVSALEKQDRNLIAEANAMLDEARKGIRDYNAAIKKLAKEHDVKIEELKTQRENSL
ncbi:hypothetical protein ACFX4Y_07755 [Priestia sp. YIM B13446]|uniref:hypothetical protein n=1 Tax=Priestia TaxID=2800373 RepID=UPI000BF61C0C|nr:MULTISPECIES: hypothetical protein [Priestia]RCX25665.1 hypothetical protein DEU47_103689 [Bacillus sp. AG236]MBX9994171.1 hypothetical protein [Priestia aryabhattai]MCM3151901.1 hypothetical protein [Priestia megaterium]MCP1451520.1 uncharacterized protein (UPF0335 family) [Priestia megaterium]MCU7739194.1 hypothetical protein [Priestia megaterium]